MMGMPSRSVGSGAGLPAGLVAVRPLRTCSRERPFMKMWVGLHAELGELLVGGVEEAVVERLLVRARFLHILDPHLPAKPQPQADRRRLPRMFLWR